MAETRALNEFPPADESAWRRRVLRTLEGRPFEQLVSHTFEGLEIEPLYEHAAESPRTFRQDPGPWKIAQRIDHPDPASANLMARTELDGGADALVLTVSGAPAARGFGTRIRSLADLDATLEKIDLDRVPLRIDAGTRSLEFTEFLRLLARHRRLTSAALDMDFGYDPIGAFARSGFLPREDDDIGRKAVETSHRLRDSGFTGRLFLADGRPYHEAGAGEAQELALVLATGVAYLRLLEAQGRGLEAARGEIAFLLAADADAFLTLAKFRALRRLWAHVDSACGLAPKPIRLHAETSFRMMTRTDPRVNVLRTTIAAFAAAIGGADTITILPYTLALGLPDEAARRLARNAGLVLIHEAHLAKVADPAAGSGAFEALTDELCTLAWALFQRLESAGGMIASLAAGLPQALIVEAADARRTAIANRRLPIIGTSAFPDLAEAPAVVLETASTASHEPHTIAAATCSPLPVQRDAEPFERLRATADAFLARTGARPRILVVALGSTPSVAGDAEFARDLFATAGIEAVVASAQGTPEESAAAFRRSGCRIACICAARSVTQDVVVAHLDGLRAAGAAGLYLVGANHDFGAGLPLDGDVKIVTDGCDVVAVLRSALALATALPP